MRVIVTRPAISATRTAAKIFALGHKPVLLPLFKAEHNLDAVLRALVERPSGLLLTSAEAVRCLKEVGAADEAFRTIPIHAVGEATAEAARNIGFVSVSTSEGNGEALAKHVADIHEPDLPPLLYLAGEPRSPGLERGLEERGISFRTVTAYRMTAVPHAPEEIDILFDGPTIALLYSREAALRFAALLNGRRSAASQLRSILCLSPAIAAALPTSLAPLARAASEPREDCLLALLPPARD